MAGSRERVATPPSATIVRALLRCAPIGAPPYGGMAEWLKAHAWKACIRETVSWVRIPLPPPVAGPTDYSASCVVRRESGARPVAHVAARPGTPTNCGGPVDRVGRRRASLGVTRRSTIIMRSIRLPDPQATRAAW